MQSILEDSAASMEDASVSLQTQTARRAWWSARAGLDQRLAALLRTLQDCLGPWRCLTQTPEQEWTWPA